MLAIFSFGTVAQPETKTVILSVYETVNKAYLLAPVDINVPESATALEILVDYSGLAVTQTASGYVSAIGGFTEKQYGGASGWLYYINGKKPGVGLGGCTPTDGDKIELRYEGVSRTQSSAGASSIQGAPASQAGSSAQTSAASSQNTVASTAASAQSATAAAVPSAGESATVGEGSEPQPS
ncbi:MAG: DUF4430 domain-containing protein, partial [Oscillospiraceae bacterium]|nr:DUF4430 domain-containing protein [Oscillospiraceae bacterium]